jgi:uncharacterized membrane protein YhaH (DUF805 family)
MMDWLYLLDTFHGRIGRKTFWIAMAIVGVANFLACYAAQQIAGDKLNAIVDLAFNYPEFAIAVKRGNDRDWPLWPVAIFFAGSVLLDLFSVLGLAGTDAEPSTLAFVVAVPFSVVGLGLLIELGFRRGTVGANRYGPDPLAGVNRKD